MKELTLMEGSKNKMRHLKKLHEEQVIDSEKLETIKAEMLSQI